MIERLSGFPDSVLAFECTGTVTKDDYETILIPAVEETLKTHSKVRLYYRIGRNLNGFEAGTAWDDFKVGMEHFSNWDRAAVVTDVDWIVFACKALGFLVPGGLKTYFLTDETEAHEWITEGL